MVDVWVIGLPRESLKHASIQYNGMEYVHTFRVKMPVFTNRISASDSSEICSVASGGDILSCVSIVSNRGPQLCAEWQRCRAHSCTLKTRNNEIWPDLIVIVRGNITGASPHSAYLG